MSKTSLLKKIKKVITDFGVFFLKYFGTPKQVASFRYRVWFGRSINWENPTELNEKIRWMQFNTDTTKWTLLADKYKVRDYLEEQGYGEMLVKLYGVWEKAEDIDFSQLPSSFVIKTNHDSGNVHVVVNKENTDLELIRNQLSKALKVRFGIETAEPHYLKIHPVIIAEEMLKQDSKVSSSLIDYKFYCVNGDPQFCAVMYNRQIDKHTYDVRLYDNEWNDISHLLAEGTHIGEKDVPCPKNFEIMKKFCREICKAYQFVRMDFYECNGKLYFGEFTFTPAACTGGSLSARACKILSEKMLEKQ